MPVLTAAQALTVFAACTAGLVLLFLLRQRARRVVVPTLAPWLEGRPRRVDPLWRELLALLLQILAVGLLCAALVPPEAGEAGAAPPERVVIVDGSASMRAPARLAAARQVAGALGGGIVLAGDSPRLLVRPGASAAQRELALTRIEPGFGGFNLEAALALVAAQGWEPVVLSDAGPPEGVAIDWRVVGPGGADVAVERVLAAAGPGLPPEHAVRVALFNHGPAREATLRLEGGGGVIGEERVSLPEDGRFERTWRVEPIAAEWVQVRVTDAADALPDNDVGFAVLPALRPAEVWLLGPGNRYIEGVLRFMPGLKLRKSGTAAQPDLVVFDRAAPRRAPPGAAVALIDPPAGAGPMPPVQRVDQPVFTSWNYEHPLLRGVALRQLAVDQVSVLSVPAGATVVASVTEGPVIAASEDGALVLGFDLTRSDLPLSIAFPQLVYNLVLWARQDLARGPAAENQSFFDLNPSGELSLRRPDQAGEARWSGAAARVGGLPPGVWEVVDDAGVRLLSSAFPAEEHAQPGAGIEGLTPTPPPEALAGTARWTWLCLLAFAVLFAEYGVAPR